MKDLFLNKPYNLLLIAAAFLVVFSFAHLPRELDVNFQDTYFVISTKAAIIISVFFCIGCWLAYFITRKYRLMSQLTWMHIIITLVFISLFFKASVFGIGLYGIPKRYYAFDGFQNSTINAGLLPFTIMSLLFCVAQVLFVFNVAYNTIKRNRQFANYNNS